MNTKIKSPVHRAMLIFSLLLIFACNQTDKKTQPANIVEKAFKAPDFTLSSLENDTIKLKDYKGKFVVLHIATTWCPFCNAEAPHLEKLYQDYKDKNVAVLLMDVKEPKELIEEKLKKKYNLTFPILLDYDGSVAATFAPKNVLPDLSRDEVMLASNILIDPEGNIQFMSLLDSKNFDAELIQLKKRLDELL
ncbi:MAG TPA: TlpA disulfide reductase family protein [Flavobacteriaceae bacterium]|jgi:peroxiredoxin